MADKDCISLVTKALDLDEFDAAKLKGIDETLDELRVTHADDPKELRKAFKAELDSIMKRSTSESISRVDTIIKGQRASDHIIGDGVWKSAAKRLLDYFEGNNSRESTFRTKKDQYMNMFTKALKDNDLERAFNSGEFDKEIRIEAYNRANDLPRTDNPQVSKLVDTIKALNNKIHEDMQLAGMDVGFRKDFLLSRSFSTEKLLNLGKDLEESRKIFTDTMIAKYIDVDKTFSKGVIESEGGISKVIGDMYDDLVASRSPTAVESEGAYKSFLGKMNKRKLELKDGAAEFDLHNEFGDGSKLAQGINQQMDSSAKTYSAVEGLGLHTSDSWEKIQANFVNKFRGKVSDNELKIALDKAQRAYINVIAPIHQPSTALNTSVKFVRSMQAATKLGSTLATAGYDINTTALQYVKRSGNSMTEGMIRSFVTFIKTMHPKRVLEVANAFNTGVHYADPAIMAGGHAGDYATGFNRLDKWFSNIMKATGVPYQTAVSRATGAQVQAGVFKNMLGRLDDLDGLEAFSLKEYDLSMDDMKLMRDNITINEAIGGVTTDDIFSIDLGKFHENTRTALKKREKLFVKYSNWLNDSVHKGTPTPGAKVKRQLGKDVQGPAGDIISLIMQFKETAWQILLANKEAAETINSVKGGSRTALTTAEYAAWGIITYSLIETTRAKLMNEPTPMEKLERGEDLGPLIIQALNKSSIAPMLTDAVEQGTRPFIGSSVIDWAAGPTGGTVKDLFNIAKSKKKGKAARRFMNSHVVPGNMILKGLMRNNFEYNMITGDKVRRDK